MNPPQQWKFRHNMNVLLLGNTMSFWFLVVGLSFFTNPVEVSDSSPPHMSRICYVTWTRITQPTLRWKTEKAQRFKSSGIWCTCNCSIKITHKAHSYQRSATQPSPKSAKTQTQNQHSSSSSSSLLSLHFLHRVVLPIPVRHHIKSHCL